MSEIIRYFAGTARMTERPEHKNEALRYMQKNGIGFYDVCEKDGVTSFTVTAGRAGDKDLLKLASVTKTRGILKDLKKLLRRPGICIGALIFAAGLLLSDDIVWDVRFVPGGGEDVARIEQTLYENGLYAGAVGSRVDRRYLENLVMMKCPDVAYVRINMSGTVATVVTDERIIPPEQTTRESTDLKASEDGYIIRYETYAGRTVVEKGQTVKAGDLLISGTYETFHSGTVTVPARGRVYALVCRSFVCEYPRTVFEKTYTGNTYTERIPLLFSRRLRAGKDHDSCEKETRTDAVTVFGAVTLPVKIETSTYREYIVTNRAVTEREAYAELQKKYEAALSAVVGDGQLQSVTKKVEISDGKYKIYCEAWLVCNIAK